MEKRLLTFIIITFAFFTLYSYFVPRKDKVPPGDSKISSQKIENETEGLVEVTPSAQSAGDSFTVTDNNRPEEEQRVELDNFYVTFSLRGGYIKEIVVKKYNEPLSFSYIGLIPGDKERIFKLRQQGQTILLINSKGETEKKYIFDRYTVSLVTLDSKDFQNMVIFAYSTEAKGLDQRYQELFFRNTAKDGAIERVPIKKAKKESLINSDFIGVRDRYFCLALFNNEYKVRLDKNDRNLFWMEAEDKPLVPWEIYIGPQSYKELSLYKLEEIINYGFFHSIGVILIKVLYFFTWMTKNWGVSILLLSFFIYLVLFPFTAKSTKAMKKMQEFQPMIEELKQKYKDNPQRLNKEIMTFYQQNRINPLGGCLPVFFQLPIFFALYQVLLRFVELKGARFLWINDLSLPDRAVHLPVSLPFIKDYINFLPVILMILGVIQQRFTMQSSSQDQQKFMGMFFAVFLGVIFYNFPSGLVLYWLMQNSLTLIYQWRISRLKTLN